MLIRTVALNSLADAETCRDMAKLVGRDLGVLSVRASQQQLLLKHVAWFGVCWLGEYSFQGKKWMLHDSLQFEKAWVLPKLARHCLHVCLYFGLLVWLQNSLDDKDDKSYIFSILLYS